MNDQDANTDALVHGSCDISETSVHRSSHGSSFASVRENFRQQAQKGRRKMRQVGKMGSIGTAPRYAASSGGTSIGLL
jgi:hypothetical protein